MGAEQTGNMFAAGELLSTETGELSQWVKNWSSPNCVIESEFRLVLWIIETIQLELMISWIKDCYFTQTF